METKGKVNMVKWATLRERVAFMAADGLPLFTLVSKTRKVVIRSGEWCHQRLEPRAAEMGSWARPLPRVQDVPRMRRAMSQPAFRRRDAPASLAEVCPIRSTLMESRQERLPWHAVFRSGTKWAKSIPTRETKAPDTDYLSGRNFGIS